MSELAQLVCLNLLETCTTHNTATLGFYVLILGPCMEVRQNEADDPFMKHIVYTPTSAIQGVAEGHSSQQRVSTGIPLNRYEQQPEEKLASPLPVENTNNLLPQCIKRSEIPPVREVRSTVLQMWRRRTH